MTTCSAVLDVFESVEIDELVGYAQQQTNVGIVEIHSEQPLDLFKAVNEAVSLNRKRLARHVRIAVCFEIGIEGAVKLGFGSSKRNKLFGAESLRVHFAEDVAIPISSVLSSNFAMRLSCSE